MDKHSKERIATFIIIILIIIFLVWGFIGGQEAQKIGVTCDMGMGDALCWKWHTNVIGQAEEAIKDAFRR